MIDWHQVAMGGYQALLDQIQAEDLRREARIADLERRVAELEDQLSGIEVAGPAYGGTIVAGIAAGRVGVGAVCCAPATWPADGR